jgi:hypothetical protein
MEETNLPRYITVLTLLASLAATDAALAADISQVMAEYRANSSALMGKTLSVSGAVGAVYDSYVSLGDPRSFVVNCMGVSSAQLRGLRPGAQATVTGTVSSLLTGNGVSLSPCSIQ